MKKIRLELDTLAVESFDTTAGKSEERGTVHAHRPPYTEGLECESIDVCTNWDCTYATECGTCGATNCGTCYGEASCCPTFCGTCYDWTCGETYCGTCDPHCCCTCSCY
jgi:hypothetical protein